MKRWKLYILIAVGVALTAAFFYAMFGPPDIARNEASAINALRSIALAQELYESKQEGYGDYFNLRDFKYIDRVLAIADPDHPDHEPFQGYIFDMSLNADKSDWCCIAYPAKWGIDGKRNFMIMTDGVMGYNTEDGKRQLLDFFKHSPDE